MKRFGLLLTLLLIFTSKSFSQSLFLKHYSVEDGLLSSEIYAQLQDSLGYMWFATSRGVSRFDGLDFKNFTVHNGLPTNSIITMFLDQNGYIWFAGYNGTLSYFDGEKIIQYKFIDTVKKLTKNFYINNLYADKHFNIYIAPNIGGFYKIDSTGKVYDLGKKLNDHMFYLIPVGNQLFFVFNHKTNKTSNFTATLNDSILALDLPSKGLRRFAVKQGNTYYFSQGKHLYMYKPGIFRNLKTFDNEISGLYLDKKENLWVSVLYTGVYVYLHGNMKKYYFLLNRKSPITVLQDNEHSYWIPTTESGIYYLPSFNFFNYSEYGFSDFNITAVSGFNHDIYFSTFDQQLFHCTINKNIITSIENIQISSDKNFTINDILITPDGTVWLLGNYFVKFKNYKAKVIKKIWRGYALTKANDGSILATTRYGFFKYCDQKICYTFQDRRVPTSNSIYQDDSGTIWLGSINGLFSYSGDSLFFWGNKYPILKSRINDISQYKNFILLATSGLGFVILNRSDSTILNITSNDGLTSDFITKILVQDSIIWLGTNKGLVKLKIQNYDKKKYTLENFTHSDGLFAEEIRDLTLTDSTIFLGTSKGLVSFFPSKLKKQFIYPKILIDKITIDGKKISFDPSKDQKIKLKANQRNLTIYFKAISFRAGKSIVYRYKIKGYDDSWNLTKNRYIRLPNLPGGHYTFYLTASAEPNVWSPNQVKIQIIKKQKFTKTSYFYILLVFIIASIITAISYLRITTKQRQLEHERQLMQAEQRALRSQMNPHFIFNALNSIRRFILENDMDKADYYLTSFATLMRKVLDNSRQNFITLDNEIQTLKLYLELERMRFDDSFSFQIDIDPNIDLHNWMIPPMIIQPFAENAIWHGLAMKPSEGKLQLIFKKTDDKVIVIIEDNGIGREKAREIAARRKGHKSTGLANTKERLNLIYKLYGKKIGLEIIDLYKDGKPAGTRVILSFPNFADVSSFIAS